MSDEPTIDLAELFLRDPKDLSKGDVLASLPYWRKARENFNVVAPKAPKAPKTKKIDLGP
jgi:hypothetical protein